MTGKYQVFIVLFALSIFGGVCWSAYHYHGKYQDEKARADFAELRADSADAIMNRTLAAADLINTVTGTTHNAKTQITLESQRAAEDVTASVAGDDCSGRLVPTAAVNRLRDYADRLRSGSGTASASEHDGRDAAAANSGPANVGREP